jgi:DNA-binding response OmpR family regulator
MLRGVARLLLIDDDASLLEVLRMSLVEAGHDVAVARDGAEGLSTLRERAPDLVVSDINMPRLDGYAFVRKVREAGNKVPIILLTSRDSEIDEALGLELGADDYVTKPFSTRVLLARILALLRREELRAGVDATTPEVRAGGLVLSQDRLEARYRDQPFTVTVTEFRLLEAMVRRPGMVLSRERLLQLARGDDASAADRVIDTFVKRLRRKLEAIDPAFDAIETVVGAGYRWKDR